MRTTIRNCTFAFRCVQNWQELEETDDRNIRFCPDCKKQVFFCSSEGEIAQAIKWNRCIAIENPERPKVLLGLPASD
jgi:hypothetical protein